MIRTSEILNKNKKKEKKLQDDQKAEKALQARSDRAFIDEQVALLEGFNDFKANANEIVDITEDMYNAELPVKEISDIYEMSIFLANERLMCVFYL
jgi:hypothetical protein